MTEELKNIIRLQAIIAEMTIVCSEIKDPQVKHRAVGRLIELWDVQKKMENSYHRYRFAITLARKLKQAATYALVELELLTLKNSNQCSPR